jgi:hypothetical protein
MRPKLCWGGTFQISIEPSQCTEAIIWVTQYVLVPALVLNPLGMFDWHIVNTVYIFEIPIHVWT